VQQVAQTIQQIVVDVSKATSDCMVRAFCFMHVPRADALRAQGVNGGPPVPFGDDDAQKIVNVLTTFVVVHQKLLSTASRFVSEQKWSLTAARLPAAHRTARDPRAVLLHAANRGRAALARERRGRTLASRLLAVLARR
jgi:hypothetical protein